MSARLLPLIGLIALMFVDSVSARPRRVRRSIEAPTAVASPTTASEPMKQVIYPVADLIVPIPSRANLDVEPLPRSTANAANAKCSFEECDLSPLALGLSPIQPPSKLLRGQTLEHQLMDLVKNMVSPKTWIAAGGVGTLQYYPLSMSLVVNQTAEVQEEVRALLAALRRLQDVQAVVEMRIVTATPAAFERACKQMNITSIREEDNPAVTEERVIGPKGKRWTAGLDDCQVRELLSLVQSDPSTNVTQAPKITMFSGQKAALEVTENQFYLTELTLCLRDNAEALFIPSQKPFTTGLRVGVQPVVAADRRATRVQLKGYWCQVAAPVALQRVDVAFPGHKADGKDESAPFRMHLQKPKFSQVRLDQDINLSDGHTALVSCGVVPVEVDRDDFSACWHGFWTGEKLTTSADRHVFFLVTSRISVNEEEEVRWSGTIPRP